MAEPESVGAIADEIKQPQPERPALPQSTQVDFAPVSAAVSTPREFPNLKSKWRYHVGSLPSDPYVAFVLFAPGENPAPFVEELFEAGHWPCMIGLYGPSEADVDAIADELLEKGHVIEMQNWDGYLFHRNVPISKGAPDHEV
jgi:hypothetical protein